MERRGQVLRLLTVLKQICNHPAQYLHQRSPIAGRSGKLAALEELLGVIVAEGDSVLVFSQFVEMLTLIEARLADLGVGTLLLHGGVQARRRNEMVEAFQAGTVPVFLLSLKAGGVGLNLTRATHVVHYDRWWNPAVEDQATDRAHRIGQDRPVQVHRLVAEGTLEDRIATMLERKRDLADAVVGEGEAWLTELSDDELAELVALGSPGDDDGWPDDGAEPAAGRRRGRTGDPAEEPDPWWTESVPAGPGRVPAGRREAALRGHLVGGGLDRRPGAPGWPRPQPPPPGPHLRPHGPGRVPRAQPGPGDRRRPGQRRTPLRRRRPGRHLHRRRMGTGPRRPGRPGRPPAALVDGELPPAVAEDVRSTGLDLLPGPGEIRATCNSPTGPIPASTPPPSATWWPTSSTGTPSPCSSCGAGAVARC